MLEELKYYSKSFETENWILDISKNLSQDIKKMIHEFSQ